jgi:membrane associated rhomboid family serine protease
MFPLGDVNPTRNRAVVTWVIIALCVGAFVYQLTLAKPDAEAFVRDWAFTPARLSNGDPLAPVTILTSMFMHSGFMHIAGNLWFLRIFGDNVEDAVGPTRYVVLYLVAGIAAAGAQYIAAPNIDVPMLGASGAIGGVLGAYAVLYPRARVRAIVIGFFSIVEVPALLFLGLWFGLQLFSSVGAIGRASGGGGGGVAYLAHVGGFVTGIVLALVFRPRARGTPQDGSGDDGWRDPFGRGSQGEG